MIEVYTHPERMSRLRATAKTVTATQQSRVEFLQRAGIYDKHGNLASMYK